MGLAVLALDRALAACRTDPGTIRVLKGNKPLELRWHPATSDFGAEPYDRAVFDASFTTAGILLLIFRPFWGAKRNAPVGDDGRENWMQEEDFGIIYTPDAPLKLNRLDSLKITIMLREQKESIVFQNDCERIKHAGSIASALCLQSSEQRRRIWLKSLG